MPKELEKKLKKDCKTKNMSAERCDRYVYGTMRNTGWKPSTQKADGGMVREYANGGKIVHTGGMHPGKQGKPC